VDTLLKMMDQGRTDQLTIDADQSDKLVKLLDAVVIKLEGGTDMDLQVLDSPALFANEVKVGLCCFSLSWLL